MARLILVLSSTLLCLSLIGGCPATDLSQVPTDVQPTSQDWPSHSTADGDASDSSGNNAALDSDSGVSSDDIGEAEENSADDQPAELLDTDGDGDGAIVKCR